MSSSDVREIQQSRKNKNNLIAKENTILHVNGSIPKQVTFPVKKVKKLSIQTSNRNPNRNQDSDSALSLHSSSKHSLKHYSGGSRDTTTPTKTVDTTVLPGFYDLIRRHGGELQLYTKPTSSDVLLPSNSQSNNEYESLLSSSSSSLNTNKSNKSEISKSFKKMVYSKLHETTEGSSSPIDHRSSKNENEVTSTIKQINNINLSNNKNYNPTDENIDTNTNNSISLSSQLQSVPTQFTEQQQQHTKPISNNDRSSSDSIKCIHPIRSIDLNSQCIDLPRQQANCPDHQQNQQQPQQYQSFEFPDPHSIVVDAFQEMELTFSWYTHVNQDEVDNQSVLTSTAYLRHPSHSGRYRCTVFIYPISSEGDLCVEIFDQQNERIQGNCLLNSSPLSLDRNEIELTIRIGTWGKAKLFLRCPPPPEQAKQTNHSSPRVEFELGMIEWNNLGDHNIPESNLNNIHNGQPPNNGGVNQFNRSNEFPHSQTQASLNTSSSQRSSIGNRSDQSAFFQLIYCRYRINVY